MEEEKEEKEKKQLDLNHGSLKVVFVFDFVAIIGTIVGLIWFPVQMEEFAYYYGYEAASRFYWIYFGYSILALIICVFVRTSLLKRGHKYIAVTLNLIFAIGWPIEFVAGLILGFSNLYEPYGINKTDENKKEPSFEEAYTGIKKIHAHYKLHHLEHLAMDEEFIKFKKVLLKYKNEAMVNLNAIKNLENRCGLTEEQQKQKEDLLSTINMCDAAINLEFNNKPDLFENELPVMEEDRINFWLEKAKDLPENKQVIFNNHKKYYDDGIYSLEEFEKKIEFLFE